MTFLCKGSKGKSCQSHCINSHCPNFSSAVHRDDYDKIYETGVTFKVEALGGATFTLGFDEDTYKNTLSVDDTPFDDLPEYKDKGDVLDVGHSTIDTHNGPNTVRIDFLLFLEGRRNTVSIEHNLRSG